MSNIFLVRLLGDERLIYFFLSLLLCTSLFAGAWTLMLTTDGFLYLHQCTLFLACFCTAILLGLFDPRYPHPSLVLKGYELCTGNRLVVKDQRRFPRDLIYLCV
jgi:hypothetical protein